MSQKLDCTHGESLADEIVHCHLVMHRMRTCLTNIIGISEGFQAGIFGQITEPQAVLLSVVEKNGYDLLHTIDVVSTCPNMAEEGMPAEVSRSECP